MFERKMLLAGLAIAFILVSSQSAMSQSTSDLSIQGEVPLLSRPYAERQLIIVVDDAVAAAEHQAKREAAAAKKEPTWADIAARIVLLRRYFIPVYAVEALIKAVIRLRTQAVDVLIVGRSEAAQLTFPPGHPLKGVLYVGNPAIPSVDYTTAQFHRLTFEHKVSEAVRMLMFLGATQLEVEHVMGWSREFAAKLNVPLGTTGQQLGDEAGQTKESRAQILFRATLKGTKNPALPEGLISYLHEPSWQSIAEGRLKHGLQNFSLSVQYEEDYGINAGLKLKASNADLDLGGKFEDHEATVWRIVGAFWPSTERSAGEYQEVVR